MSWLCKRKPRKQKSMTNVEKTTHADIAEILPRYKQFR
ncbi:hypothetical protein AZ25_2930 [Bordetella holmesii 04P3421]|nr:hypothetical protein D555_1847 [Bordetella holmesii 35009]KAK84624.1 hypothetical protein L503_3494 [Bordetella holmesii CDC-H809-BH]KCV08317.1 hypothetical protein AZ25_2930 [Bordetella holmesii 04P3421]